MRRLFAVILCLLLVCAWGCKRGGKKKSPAEREGASAGEAAVEEPADLDTEDDFAVSVDFEAEADDQITADNYKEQLDVLERKIDEGR